MVLQKHRHIGVPMELNVNSACKLCTNPLLARVCIVCCVCTYVQLVFYSYLKFISGNWIWETKQHLVTQTPISTSSLNKFLFF